MWASVTRVLLAAMPLPLHHRLAGRHRGVTCGKDDLRRRRLIAVEEGGIFGPLAEAAEGQLPARFPAVPSDDSARHPRLP